MKKNSFNVLVILLSCLVALFSISSCKKESEKMAVTTATADDLKTTLSIIPNSEIGYLNENNQFVAVTELQLLKFIIGLEFVSENGKITEYGVVQDTDEAGNTHFALLVKAKDGEFKSNSIIQLNEVGNNQYAITQEGCSCKSSFCSDDGCVVDKLKTCACTPCDGSYGVNCEKTHTTFTPYRVQSLFN